MHRGSTIVTVQLFPLKLLLYPQCLLLFHKEAKFSNSKGTVKKKMEKSQHVGKKLEHSMSDILQAGTFIVKVTQFLENSTSNRINNVIPKINFKFRNARCNRFAQDKCVHVQCFILHIHACYFTSTCIKFQYKFVIINYGIQWNIYYHICIFRFCVWYVYRAFPNYAINYIFII